ncbi:DNA replication complex GINS family protein [Nitrosopumilus sp. K4]|uniref:DNA replication complex GINS family protein n=1 Tax=Nitrosopumilus sp. K4 TaxID=2795383 RepID=UPI001BA70CF1|nr:DNA replication complex GINS family protein [Nitrosopumilus sp. K4]QUC64609.1 DNA replication complex GINS family protein [Nitrosopumilus sp. K4]
MSESNQIDISKLHHIVLRETENDPIQEIEPNFYRELSEFIGNLKKQEFDGIESKIKDALIVMATELTSLLIEIRLNKISKSEKIEFENLLDEEKFIVDSEEEKNERKEMILSATVNGKSKFLESLSQNHKTKTVVIRFLKEVDEIVGADLERYGPFKTEDIATIPYENAQALISKNVATKVRWED